MTEPGGLIRILYTIPNFVTAGSGGALVNLIRHLDRSRFPPAVCVSRRGGRLEEVLEEMGVPVLEARFTVPATPYAGLPWRVREAAGQFRGMGFDLWHSFHYGDDYTEPLIARAAGAKAWVYTKKNMSWRGRAWKVRSLLAGGIAAQNTRMLREFFAQWWWRRKTVLIPRGVDAERFCPGAAPRLGLRRRFGVGAKAPVVVAVGQVLPVKGHELLLRAAAGLPGVHVWIAGGTEDESCAGALRRQSEELGLGDKFQLLGRVDDVAGLLAEADIFVHPTRPDGRQEGCPVALLEAMACGKACIATQVAGAEDVIETEVSGLLIPPLDVEGLREALRRVLEDEGLRLRLGEGARARILAAYTVQREARQHEQFYLRVLGEERQ